MRSVNAYVWIDLYILKHAVILISGHITQPFVQTYHIHSQKKEEISLDLKSARFNSKTENYVL